MNYTIPEKMPSVPTISIISAMDNGYNIGYKNQLPWKDDRKRYKWDMDYFVQKTMYNMVLMGWNTMLSLNKPLSNRINIVLNPRKDFIPNGKMVSLTNKPIMEMMDLIEDVLLVAEEGKFLLVDDIKEALLLASYCNADLNEQELFIIGGSKTYKEILDLNIASNAYLTIFEDEYEADCKFPIQEFNKHFVPISECRHNGGRIMEFDNKCAKSILF